MQSERIPKDKFDVRITLSLKEAKQLRNLIGHTSRLKRIECFGDEITSTIVGTEDIFEILYTAIDRTLGEW